MLLLTLTRVAHAFEVNLERVLFYKKSQSSVNTDDATSQSKSKA